MVYPPIPIQGNKFLNWDVESALFLQSFSVINEEDTPTDFYFRDDGLKMFLTGTTGNEVNEYDLSTAWAVTSAVFLQKFDLLPLFRSRKGLFFKDDGFKMYSANASDNRIEEYDLSTAWNVTTAVFLQSFDTSGQTLNLGSLFFKTDGFKMYIIGQNPDNKIFEYDLSTAWAVTSAVFLQSFNTDPETLGVFIRPDGKKMYITGNVSPDKIFEYDLSTAWDVSSASLLKDFIVTSQDTNPNGVFWKPDGIKMYILGGSNKKIFEYNVG